MFACAIDDLGIFRTTELAFYAEYDFSQKRDKTELALHSDAGA
jgi:hypothetical protein